MSQSPETVEKVSFAVSEGVSKAEGILSTFLQSHPELADALANFGTKNDILTVVMVGLGLSFLILLSALMLMRPRNSGNYIQPMANEKLLFSKYAYDLPEGINEE